MNASAAPQRAGDPQSLSWLAGHRASVESLLTELARAEADSARGLTLHFDPAAVYARHRDVAAPARHATLRQRAADDPGAAALARHAAEINLAERTRSLRDRIARVESEVRSTGGRSLGELRRRTNLEPDPARALHLEYELAQGYAQHLAPLWMDLRAMNAATVRELGYPDVVAYVARTTATDVDALCRDARVFLAATRPAYDQVTAPVRATLAPAGLRVADLLRTIRLGVDAPLTLDAAMAALSRTTDQLGIDGWHGRVELDLVARDGKAPGAFCVPIKIPGDVVVSVAPVGSIEDCRGLLHEVGHGLHFVHTQADLPVEVRRLGDLGLVEAWGMLFEHLFVSPHWVGDFFAGHRDRIVADSVRRLLIVARLQCVRLLFQREAADNGADVDDLAARYRALMGEHLDVRPGVTEHLRDMASGFSAAPRLRSWMFEFALRRHLCERHGDRWMFEPAAGSWLVERWAVGQPHDPQAALRAWGVSCAALADLAPWFAANLGAGVQ